MWLRQSTASQEIMLGPFLDSTDGNTAETALTIANTDIKIWKEGATTEANKNSGGATHIASGRYYAVLDATDTDTLGKLEVNVHVSGALAVRREFMVVPANVYDSLILGTDTLQADTVQWLGTACATPTVAGVPEVDLTHVGGATTNVAALATNVDAILTDTADIQPKIGTPAGASVSADIAAVKSDTAATLIDTSEIGLAGAGLTALASAADLAIVAGYIDTEVAAIKAKTDSLTFTVAGQLDANIQSVNDVAITGDGSATPFDVV